MTGRVAVADVDWEAAADWQDGTVDLDDALEQSDWAHTNDRTPYENVVALVTALPRTVSDHTIAQIAYRRVPAMGETYVPNALERAREKGEIPPEGGDV